MFAAAGPVVWEPEVCTSPQPFSVCMHTQLVHAATHNCENTHYNVCYLRSCICFPLVCRNNFPLKFVLSCTNAYPWLQCMKAFRVFFKTTVTATVILSNVCSICPTKERQQLASNVLTIGTPALRSAWLTVSQLETLSNFQDGFSVHSKERVYTTCRQCSVHTLYFAN